MRRMLSCASIAALSIVMSAQTPNPRPNPRDVKLRGDRFKPLTYDEMTPAQKAMIEHLFAGERGAANGPFNALLRSPEVGDATQALGAQLRFHSSLPSKVREMVILITARYWTAQYEWVMHHRLALEAGLSPAICDAIAMGRKPNSMAPDEQAAYNFAMELLNTKQVSDATFAAAKQAFSEQGVVDETVLIGYYGIVSAILNVDRYPLAEGSKPELPNLK